MPGPAPDRDAVGRIAAARQALDAALNADPYVAAARACVDGASGSAEAVARAITPLIASTAWLDAMLGHARAAIAREPLLELRFAAMVDDRQRTLSLIETPAVRIALVMMRAARLDPAPSSVRVGGHLVLHRLLRPGAAVVERWHGAAIGERFSFATTPALRRGECFSPDGETILVVDGRRDGLVMLSADADIVMLRATILTDADAYARLHSTADGRIIGAAVTDEAGSRMAVLASMLGAMQRADAAPAIAGLLDERDFSLRWLGARLLLRLDPDTGRPAIARLSETDPHPEVRAAAAAAIKRFAPAAEALG